MKWCVKAMGYGVILIVAVVVALMAYVRLADSDPRVWDVALPTDTPLAPGPCLDHMTTTLNSARVVCAVPGDPVETLRRLDSIALATPGTTLLAGSPEAGRMTWVTRSRLMGYPDYTTAQVTAAPEGTRLDIFARSRFGKGDLGVNAARLMVWLTALDPT